MPAKAINSKYRILHVCVTYGFHHSAVGPDIIRYQMLKHWLKTAQSLLLLDLYNFWQSGELLKSWLEIVHYFNT